MTRNEAEAVNLVLRWAFARKPYVEPDALRRAMLTLARASYKTLGNGISGKDIERWT